MGIDFKPRIETLKTEAPAQRKGGIIVKDVDELIAKLKTEAKVLWEKQKKHKIN